jgi:trimeric autotransporter adhesin
MNRIYKSVWSETTRTWVATSENARSKTRRGVSRKLIVAQTALAAAVLMGCGAAYADADAAAMYFDASGSGTAALDSAALAGPNMQAVAAGDGAFAQGQYSVAVGGATWASKAGSTAIGYNAFAGGAGSFAGGMNAIAADDAATALGSGARVVTTGGTALGSKSMASGVNAVAIGTGAAATSDNSVALGANSTTTADLTAPAYAPAGPGATGIAGTNPAGEVSVGSAGQERRITNVAAGAAPTDAVNVSQLSAVDDKVDSLANSAVQYDANPDGNKNSITLAGPISSDGGVTGGTTMTNLHQGAVSATSTDAINGAQLFAVTGDTSATYIADNGTGIKYVRTNDTGLAPDDAHASGFGSSAVGYNAQASGDASTALGPEAQASGFASSALGLTAQASGDGSSALGSNAQAAGTASTAVGYASNASGFASTAMGVGATAAGDGSTAVGWAASATGASSTALGDFSVSNGAGSVAVGVGAAAQADGSVALGSYANASAANSVALGNNANASAANSVALGANSTTTADLTEPAQSFGADPASIAGSTPVGEVSVGSAGNERRITNVAAGAAPTDAVNVSQLSAVDSKIDTVVNSGALHYFKADGPADGSDDAAASGAQAVAAGANAEASGDQSSALGSGTQASGASATAVGSQASASGSMSTAIGANANAVGNNSVALGQGASASADGSVALGQGSLATRANSVSVGSVGNERTITNVAPGVEGTDAVNVNQLNAVASQAASTAAGAVRYDTNPDGSVNKGSVTLGGDGGTVIHNVADGVVATDAVNLGQLDAAIGSAINNLAPTAGGSPFFSADGDVSAEAAQSTGTHATAAGANANASGTNAVAVGANSVASGNNTTALGAGANASADNSVALGQSSVADRANTVSVGAAGSERQITNVAPGVQGTDAVNVNQLNSGISSAVGQANSYTDDQVRSARRDSYGGTASALAAAGLPQAVLPGHGMVAIAGGTYAGQSAVAVGVSQLSETGKWVYKVQGTSDSRGQFGASVGAGMHW